MSNTSDPSPRIPGHPSSQVSRRAFLGGTLAAASVGIGLSACASPIAAGLTGSKINPGTVDYWNLFGGGDLKLSRLVPESAMAAIEGAGP